MPEIRVTFGELSAAQQNVLRRFLAPLTAGWEGQAAQDYQLRQRQWDTAAADLTAVLAQIGVALGTANDNDQAVERANAARWR
jgi:WXG100 family type VII secretion target